MNKIIQFNQKILDAVKTMSKKEYWNRPNIVEAWGFATKIAIISSVCLIWSSTKKTLPTIILFNVAWVILATLSIVKHFL